MSTCSLRIVMTTPEAMMTGKKKIARTRVRPRNLSRSSMAHRRLNVMMTGT